MKHLVKNKGLLGTEWLNCRFFSNNNQEDTFPLVGFISERQWLAFGFPILSFKIS